MFTPRPHPGTHLHTAARQAAARLRRLATALAAVSCALLASAVMIPAASASIPIPPGGPAVPAPAVRVVTAGGMAGWQITSIAIGSALFTATAAVLLYRALAVRKAASAATA